MNPRQRAGEGEPKEGAMILELAWPYVPVVVVTLFWAIAMRPLLRVIHAPAVPGRRPRR